MNSWVRSLTVLLAAAALPLAAQTSTAPAAPDNTKVNKRDRAKSAKTADQANNNAADRETMRKIRRAIMDDKSLSTYAHNVKVIAENGKVTLKGPVRSDEEKQTIETKATEIAGAGNVTNQLTVKPAKSAARKSGKTS